MLEGDEVEDGVVVDEGVDVVDASCEEYVSIRVTVQRQEEKLVHTAG